MSRYRMSLDSGWDSNAFEPFKEVEFKTADKKTIVYFKIVHGEWIDKGHYRYCSVCNYNNPHIYNYCPNCGAKMERGEDGE